MDGRVMCNYTKCDYQIDKYCSAPTIAIEDWNVGSIWKPTSLPVCSSFKPRRSVVEKLDVLSTGARV
jgi:hypothetical protein